MLEDLITKPQNGKFQIYEAVSEGLLHGVYGTDSRTPWKVALFTHRSNAADLKGPKVYADLRHEVADGNGYTTGGADTAASWTTSEVGSTYFIKLDVFDVRWTASGGPIAARYVVIYKDAAAKPLVCVCVLDTATRGDFVTADGGDLSIEMNPRGVLAASLPVEDAVALRAAMVRL